MQKLCPFRLANVDQPGRCSDDCALYVEGANCCAIRDLTESLSFLANVEASVDKAADAVKDVAQAIDTLPV